MDVNSKRICFQTFSEQSLSILEELSRSEQLEVIERMSSLGNSIVSGEGSNLGKFSRKGKTIYRMRFGDLRIYFEKMDLLCIVSTCLKKFCSRFSG